MSRACFPSRLQHTSATTVFWQKPEPSWSTNKHVYVSMCTSGVDYAFMSIWSKRQTPSIQSNQIKLWVYGTNLQQGCLMTLNVQRRSRPHCSEALAETQQSPLSKHLVTAAGKTAFFTGRNLGADPISRWAGLLSGLDGMGQTDKERRGRRESDRDRGLGGTCCTGKHTKPADERIQPAGKQILLLSCSL